MTTYLQMAMEYFRNSPEAGLLFTFMIAFIESLPLLGTLFPGAITMTAVGALIGAGVLPPTGTCIAAILGALSGDCIGFWLGKRYHENIKSIWPINKLNNYFNHSEKFFHKHGGKSIIIGRFIGPTRAAMPLIAGILQYSWRNFLTATVFAALLWSLVYMTPGILLGALAIEFPRSEMSKIFLYGLGLIIALWLIFWFIQFFFKQLSRAINFTLQRWWRLLNHSPKSLFVRLIYNHQHPKDFHQLKLILFFLLSSLLFLMVFLDIIQQGFIFRLNRPFFYLLQSFRTPRLDQFWAFLTVLGTPEAVLVISLLAALGLGIYKQWRVGIHLALVGLGACAAALVFKKIHYSPRPENFLMVDPGSSFPSGHTTLSIAVFGFIAFLSGKIFPSHRRLIYGFYVLFVFLISLSRLFLGQHWLTDILAAWFLGLSILLFMILSYRRLPKTNSMLKMRKKIGLLIISLSAIVPWAFTAGLTYKEVLNNTQPVWPIVNLNYQNWWQNPLIATPLYRLDRLGRPGQPFNIQWVASSEEITKLLIDQGWELIPDASRLKTLIKRFTSLQPENNREFLNWLYQNKPPEIFLIKHLPGSQSIMELRLWQSTIKFTDSAKNLWLGILIYHQPPEKILRFPYHYMHLQAGDSLMPTSREDNALQFKIAAIPLDQQPERMRNLQWNGVVYIIRDPHYQKFYESPLWEAYQEYPL